MLHSHESKAYTEYRIHDHRIPEVSDDQFSSAIWVYETLQAVAGFSSLSDQAGSLGIQCLQINNSMFVMWKPRASSPNDLLIRVPNLPGRTSEGSSLIGGAVPVATRSSRVNFVSVSYTLEPSQNTWCNLSWILVDWGSRSSMTLLLWGP